MADEPFATKIEDADSNEPGLVLTAHDDLSLTLETPDGKTIPLDGLTTGGGGGGGGPATIADGADVAEGSTTDAAVAAGAAGTVSAKLRRLTTDTDAIKTSVAAIDAGTPAALGAGGGMKVDGSGTALPVSAASLPLPAGAATSALQGGGLPAALGAGGGVKIDGSGTALPVSGTVTATSTVADGANVVEGATADAANTTGTTGTISGKLRGIVTLLASALKVGGSVASDLPVTDNPILGGGRASTAVPSAVSADGDSVAAWLTRNGAEVVDGGVASGASDSGSPVKVGGKYNATSPTFTDGQRGDLQMNSKGAIIATLGGSLANVVAFGGDSADGVSTANVRLPAMASTQLYNGTTHDRQRANVEAILLASAARTATVSSADQTNYNGRGILVVINVTAEAGTTTLTLTIQGKDSISANYYDLITGLTVYNAATDTPTVTRAVLVYPGVLTADAIGPGNANLISAKALTIPRTWRATVTPSDASSQTYSLSGVTLL